MRPFAIRKSLIIEKRPLKMNNSVLAVILFYILGPLSAVAGTFRVDSTTAFSSFAGDDLKAEIPLYEIFQAHYASDDRQTEFNTYFSVLENFSRANSQFDLYSLDASIWAVPDTLKISFGRSFHTHLTVRPHLLDSLSVESFFLNKSLRLGGYIGIEKSPEDLSGEKSKITGFSAGYTNSAVFAFTTGVRLEHQEFTGVARDRLKLSFLKLLDFSYSPELMLDLERDLKFNQWSRAELGLDLTPNLKSTMGLRYQVYELDPLVGGEDPILNVISQGRVNEIGLKFGKLLTPDIYGSYYLARADYEIQPGYKTAGEKHQLGLDLKYDFFQLNLSLYKTTSYGGWVEGVRGGGTMKLSSMNEIFLTSDYTQYSKITSSERTAVSNQVGITNFSFKPFRLDIMGEFNSNNSYLEDRRFLIKLTTLFWKEI